MKRRAAIEQLAPVLSTAYNSFLNAIDTPRKSLERGPWFWRDPDVSKKDYASDSESESDSDDDTVTGESIERVPPPPTPDTESLRLLLDSTYVQFKHGDTPSTSPLLVVLDIVEIMLAESPPPNDFWRAKGNACSEAPLPRPNNEKKKSRRSFRRSRPTNNFDPSQAPPLPTAVPNAAETTAPAPAPTPLSCEQVMKLIDFLMKNWPTVEKTIMAMLRDNPGLRLDGCIRLLGQRILGKVLASTTSK
ncbi:hypothetical protein HDK77DRAFT_483133 [Phyllosticta capitalensis]|uniref:Uncharacterized protein n=1 Tax=Phyllosticta capitalensis TaxID=121624 RepID=A0ABR1YJN9_9PEZI